MEATLILQGLILLGILALIVITAIIGSKLKDFAIKERGANEEIYQILNSLREKLSIIDKEIENKILKNVMTDLGKTKEDLINHLTNLRETIHKTTNELSSKNDTLSSQTKQKLTEVEKCFCNRFI
jgi:DNA anti-recombination protein RmuC